MGKADCGIAPVGAADGVDGGSGCRPGGNQEQGWTAAKGGVMGEVDQRRETFRPLGRSGLSVSPIGFGAFKIGRNQKVKYPSSYDLPDETTVEKLLNGVLDLGINHIDTAPAYGLSEERIGKFLSHRRREYVLSTKVGEIFEEGISRYEFDARSVRQSITASLQRLRTEQVDLLLIHAPQTDVEVLRKTDVVETLLRLREEGITRFIGLSAKTIEGARLAIEWADVLMVEYHLEDQSFEQVIQEAAARGVGVLVKKGLGAGHLKPEEAIPFILRNPGVTNLVVGSLSLEHLRKNLSLASSTDA